MKLLWAEFRKQILISGWDIIILFLLVLNGPEANVTQLRTTTPLFMAYEEVYSNLQSNMCPLFYKSEEASKIVHRLLLSYFVDIFKLKSIIIYNHLSHIIIILFSTSHFYWEIVIKKHPRTVINFNQGKQQSCSKK